MRNNILETIVGAVVIVVTALFFLFVFKKSGNGGESTYNVIALFDKVDGLHDGDDIKIGGVKIGTVKAINIDKKSFMAKVTFSIKKSIKIPSDSSAEIISESFLGGKYISLVPGNDDETLQNGSLIEDTQSSVSLEQMLGKYLFSSKGEDKEEDFEEEEDDKSAEAEIKSEEIKTPTEKPTIQLKPKSHPVVASAAKNLDPVIKNIQTYNDNLITEEFSELG